MRVFEESCVCPRGVDGGAVHMVSLCARCHPVPPCPWPAGMVTLLPDPARFRFVTVSAGSASWTGWLATLPQLDQAGAPAVMVRLTHSCGQHTIRVDAWSADPPLRPGSGTLAAHLFVVAIVGAGRPELTELCPGLDQLGWRVIEWRSAAETDCVKLTIAATAESPGTLRREITRLIGGRGKVIALPAIGCRRPA